MKLIIIKEVVEIGDGGVASTQTIRTIRDERFIAYTKIYTANRYNYMQ